MNWATKFSLSVAVTHFLSHSVHSLERRSINRYEHEETDLLIQTSHAAVTQPVAINPKLSSRMSGAVLPDQNAVIPGCTLESPLAHLGLPDISNNHSIRLVLFTPVQNLS